MKQSKIIGKILLLLLLAISITACKESVPQEYKESGENARILPDYTQIVIPCNIAPLNFRLQKAATKSIVRIKGENGDSIIATCGENNEIRWDLQAWKQLLAQNKGKKLKYDLWSKIDGNWEHYQPFYNEVTADTIDPYLTYRLIEPSYMGSGNIGIYQFNLETGEETPIFTNHYWKRHHDDVQKCVNCHTAQRGHPENKMFYYRGERGGLMLTYKGKIMRVDTRCGDMFAGTVYPSWHPTLPFIAFSSNIIMQAFGATDRQKIEPYDEISDLVLYDIEKQKMTAILKTKNQQETNPCWSGDGQYLYYNVSDSTFLKCNNFTHLLYNVCRLKFNAKDKSWGKPELVFDAVKMNKSATYPKVSPDNQWLLMSVSDYGTSVQTRASSDLWIKNLKTGAARNLKEVNCPTEADSYHDWASNSKWLVVASRRLDKNYARPFFSHLGKDGKWSKPFIIPCQNPRHNDELIKNYNVVEFSTKAVAHTTDEYMNAILRQEDIKTTYGSPIDTSHLDGNTSATIQRRAIKQ